MAKIKKLRYGSSDHEAVISDIEVKLLSSFEWILNVIEVHIAISAIAKLKGQSWHSESSGLSSGGS